MTENVMPDLLTRQEAADLLKIHVATLRRWEKAEKAPRRVEMNGMVRYSRDDIQEFLRAHIRGQMTMFLGSLSGSVEVVRAAHVDAGQ